MPFDKRKFTKKLKDKYSFKDETFKRVQKDYVKDLIEVEIGDSKTISKFMPQHKVMRWDNECNVSIRLKDDGNGTETVETREDKIVWKKGKREAHFYDFTNEEHPEGAQEFEIVLLEKPATNVVEFTLQDKDVDYFYQPALTAEEIAKGASRPENVVGSYAVYAKTPKTNWKGGKEYKTGKLGHIFRPRIEDSNGNWTWGELHIENGILSVTIPQSFLDTAAYPVKHAAGLTFGYTTAGGTAIGFGTITFALASLVSAYVASTGDTVTKISIYGGTQGTPQNRTLQAAIYSVISGTPTSRLASPETITQTGDYNSGGSRWDDTAALSQSLSNGVQYSVAAGSFTADGSGSPANTNICFYDAGSAPGRISSTNLDLQATFGATGTDSGRHYSLYATYTASGGSPTPKLMLMGMGT